MEDLLTYQFQINKDEDFLGNENFDAPPNIIQSQNEKQSQPKHSGNMNNSSDNDEFPNLNNINNDNQNVNNKLRSNQNKDKYNDDPKKDIFDSKEHGYLPQIQDFINTPGFINMEDFEEKKGNKPNNFNQLNILLIETLI